MVGGLGICGRPFCCAQFLENFQPVSIKMAKTQNLSLNPTKISGTCGRLMCCLKYEQEAYEDLLKTSPKAESFVDTPDGRGTVTEVNLLKQSVKVRMEDQPETVVCYKNCDICVLRNGKAKKNDPPIPPDLAPFSGGGKRPKPAMAAEEPPMHLDPIRFRYRPDDIVEEQAPAQPKPENRRKKRKTDKLEPAGGGQAPGAGPYAGGSPGAPQKAPAGEGQAYPEKTPSQSRRRGSLPGGRNRLGSAVPAPNRRKSQPPKDKFRAWQNHSARPVWLGLPSTGKNGGQPATCPLRSHQQRLYLPAGQGGP